MYDAFISYRHTELDKFAAENLHRQLEAFRLPANIVKKTGGRRKLERVFRDKDELPLTSNLEDPIMKALAESEYLIVICSPRLRESLWCKKEIETFIALHGREKVLAVLIEGEPSESFPEELLYCEETVTLPDGSTKTERRELEPLAADIRGKNRRAMKKAMKTEILRLLAPIFSVSYDDLRQRHREQKMRKILTASLAGTAVCLAFGAVSTAMALRIQGQKEQIEAQNQEILAKTEEISRQNEELLRAQAENLAEESLRYLESGDRIKAVETARQALTSYNGIALPYTERAQYALTQSLHVYDNGSTMKPQYQLVTEGLIDLVKLSPDRESALTLESKGHLTLWKLEGAEKEAEFDDCATAVFSDHTVTFVGDEIVAYKRDGGGIAIYDRGTEQISEIDTEGRHVYGIYGSEGEYLAAQEYTQVTVYRVQDGSVAAYCPVSEGTQASGGVFFDTESGLLVFGQRDKEDNLELVLYRYNEDRIIDTWQMGGTSLQTVRFEGDRAYVLLNQYGTQNHTAILMACDGATGKLLWKNSFSGGVGKMMYLPAAEGAENLLLATSYEVRLISMADGSVTELFPVGDEVIGGGAFVDTDAFIFFTRGGVYHYLSVDNLTDYNMDMIFQCPDHNDKTFLASMAGFLVLPYQSNRITVYDYTNRDSLTAVETPVEKTADAYVEYSELTALAEEIGLADAAMARYAFYSTDNDLLFVSYQDGRLEIYDAATMECKKALTDVPDEFCYYFGQDADGNYYVGGWTYAYMLSPDFSVLARIEGMIALDAAEGSVIVDNLSEKQYRIPIYSTEELLGKADDLLGK